MVATVGRNLRSSGLDARARVVVGRAGEPDAHAVERDDGAVLEVRQRLAVGAAQVGGIERELGLGHASQEDRLAEIELVVAGRENVGRDQIGERDDVLAAVDARHQRGRERVAAHARRSRDRPLSGLGALGLDHGGEPRKAAAPLAVGHHLVGHQIDVIDQDEGDARRLRGRPIRRARWRRRPRTAASRRRRRGMEPILDRRGA